MLTSISNTLDGIRLLPLQTYFYNFFTAIMHGLFTFYALSFQSLIRRCEEKRQRKPEEFGGSNVSVEIGFAGSKEEENASRGEWKMYRYGV